MSMVVDTRLDLTAVPRADLASAVQGWLARLPIGHIVEVFVGEPSQDGLLEAIDPSTVECLEHGRLGYGYRYVLRRIVKQGDLLVVGDLCLDPGAHVAWRAGQLIALSPREFRVLELFMRNAGRVLWKRRILEHLWRREPDADPNIVETYVHYIREKIDRESEPSLIRTIRGVGYVLGA